MKILVVDDDLSCLESYGDALQVLNHEPTLCSSVPEALSQFESGSFKLVFSDIRMPEKSGIDLLQSLRLVVASRRPDVVLLTGFAELGTAIQAVRHGAFDYLKKPVIIEEMEQVIVRWEKCNPSRADQCEAATDEALYESLIAALIDPALISNPELSIDTLAKSLVTNRTVLSRMINGRFGVNFSMLINRNRITYFQRLCTEPGASVYSLEALASMAGFPSKSCFYRVFRQEVMISPSEWFKKIHT